MIQANRSESLINKRSWRRYMLRMAAALVVFIALSVVMDRAFHQGFAPEKPWLYLIAVIQAAPVAAMVFAGLRYVEDEEDEYQRMLATRAYIAAMGLTLTVTTVLGFLQDYAVLPRISMGEVFLIFVISQGLTTGWVKWRAR